MVDMSSSQRQPVVSVVMAAYNAEKYIESAIRSVVAQTFQQWELIVVNDGSSDRTLEIAQAASAKDSRIRTVTQKNSGCPAGARNTGVSASRGRFLSFLDADDYYCPQRLERVLSCFSAYPKVAAIFHDLLLEDRAGVLWKTTYIGGAKYRGEFFAQSQHREGRLYFLTSDFYKFMALHFAGVHTNSIAIDLWKIPSSFHLRFRTDLRVGEDTELWFRLARHAALGYLDEPLAIYRMHGSGVSSEGIKAAECLLRLHRELRDVLLEELTEIERCRYACKISRMQKTLAYQFLCRGYRSKAREIYVELVKQNAMDGDAWRGVGKTLLPWAAIRSRWHRWLR